VTTHGTAKDDRAERRKIMELAQARQIDAIVVTELTRWGLLASSSSNGTCCASECPPV
jgi:hypothetical protein